MSETNLTALLARRQALLDSIEEELAHQGFPKQLPVKLSAWDRIRMLLSRSYCPPDPNEAFLESPDGERYIDLQTRRFRARMALKETELLRAAAESQVDILAALARRRELLDSIERKSLPGR